MDKVTVVSLGGSIVAPDSVDVDFVRRFVEMISSRLEIRPEWRIGLVIGGGNLARRYQASLREIVRGISPDILDTVGIAATRVNAELVRAAFGPLAPDPVVLDPTSVGNLEGRVIISGGWKPGFSTDNVAVHLAASLGADTVVNLSNIAQVYTADPKIDPSAVPLERVDWSQFFRIAGSKWTPGMNTPFDPAGTKRASELHLQVIAADGRDLENVEAIFDGNEYVGTTIGPQ